MALSPGERVTVGLVRGLHGLRGAVRVEVLSDDAGRFSVGSVLYLEGEDRPLIIAWTGPTKSGLLVRFAGLADRGSVEVLRERYLEVTPDAPLPEGTWYWHEIVGLEVRTETGERLGSVSGVFRAGAGEVYVVTGGRRGEVLVPAVGGVVTELSPEAGHLVVDARTLALDAVAPNRPDAAPAGSTDAAPAGSTDAAPASSTDAAPASSTD